MSAQGNAPGIDFREAMDVRIDVAAQYALVRMSKDPAARSDAVQMLAAVKQGSLAGIYQEDQQVPAMHAQMLKLGWWQLIPQGEDAALVVDPRATPMLVPLIVFRRQVRDIPSRLDRALRKAWAAHQALLSGKLSQCSTPRAGGGLQAELRGAPLRLSNIVPANLCVDSPAPADPTERWKNVLGRSDVREGNDVRFLVDGADTFREMEKAIQSAQTAENYIYLLGWWLDINQPLIPGNVRSTPLALFSAASARGVQIRVMLWDQWVSRNWIAVKQINALANGAAILDDYTLPLGCHHQKVLIVKGVDGLVAFCGGVDINRDRVAPPTKSPGTPLHDVHCRITGPATVDLLRIFRLRWDSHPNHNDIDSKKGALRGLMDVNSAPSPTGNYFVRIAQTFNQVEKQTQPSPAPPLAVIRKQFRSVMKTMLAVIREAQRFIYIEDQYLVNLQAAAALRDTLKKESFQRLIILIPHSDISDLPQRWKRRKIFLDQLKSGLTAAQQNKISVSILINPKGGNHHTYVHSKTWIIDDEIAIIGSANCNRRGWEYDSEVIAAIGGSKTPDASPFAQQLRITLWAEHLGRLPGSLSDALASAAHWRSPPPGARIQTYDPNAGSDPLKELALPWDTAVDPSSPILPSPRAAMPLTAQGINQKWIVALSTGLRDAAAAGNAAAPTGSQLVPRAPAVEEAR